LRFLEDALRIPDVENARAPAATGRPVVPVGWAALYSVASWKPPSASRVKKRLPAFSHTAWPFGSSAWVARPYLPTLISGAVAPPGIVTVLRSVPRARELVTSREEGAEAEPAGRMHVIKDLIVDMGAVRWTKIRRVNTQAGSTEVYDEIGSRPRRLELNPYVAGT
jgi:hypothetical protein